MSNQVSGVLESNGRSGGFLRDPGHNYQARPSDARISDALCRKFELRGGEEIVGEGASGGKGGKRRGVELTTIDAICGIAPDHYVARVPFEELPVIDPTEAIRLETPGGPSAMRIVDLMTPIGFGQRGMIVAAPRTGKTILLQQFAAGVATNHPDARLIVLLVDERPEEVTHMRKSINGEVVASSNDSDVNSHVRIARLVIDRAKRLVESGQKVFLLLDSLTRVGRAFNAAIRSSGRVMSGGIDIRALTEPKTIFGAARNIEGGGSLTIIASALIETGSRMDDVIFNEFKGTGNMEIMLTRELANQRIFPAIDMEASGTRKEELLLSPEALEVSYKLRRNAIGKGPRHAMEMMLDLMNRYPTNQELVQQMGRAGIR